MGCHGVCDFRLGLSRDGAAGPPTRFPVVEPRVKSIPKGLQ